MADQTVESERAKARKKHTFDGERVQAFSDAVFAIVATFAVVPLKLSRARVIAKGGYAHFSVKDFFVDQWPRYLIYAYSFALIIDVWICHVSIFGLAEQVNDGVLWLNLVCLLLVTFFPFSTGLVSSFPDDSTDIDGEQTSIAIAAGDIAAIGISLIVLSFYIFRRQALIHPDIANNPHTRLLKRMAFVFLIISPVLAALAVAFSFLTEVPKICFFLFYLILFASAISKVVFFLILKFKGVVEKTKMALTFRLNKLRMEAFTDGVYSIAATLIVLDLTSESIPDKDSVRDDHGGSLIKALHESRHVFLAYFTSFVIIGLLWFVQYGMFHFVKKMTNTLAFFNLLSLFLVGLIPFVSGVNSIFSEDVVQNNVIGPNKIDSLRGVCVVVFLVGLSQMMFWVVAQFNKSKCLTDEVDYSYFGLLQFIKTLIFPLTCFIIFWGTFSHSFMEYHVYNYFLFAAPFILLALQGLFYQYAKCGGAVKKGIASLKSEGSTGRKEKEESPLIKEREAAASGQSYSIELTESPDASPVHVQFPPASEKGRETFEIDKDKAS